MQPIDLEHWITIRQLIQKLSFPMTGEFISYGTPSIKLGAKFLCRILEDGETMVIHADDRDEWLTKAPKVFFITEHYRNYPYVLVRLKLISRKMLIDLLIQSWKEIAPKRLLKEWQLRSD